MLAPAQILVVDDDPIVTRMLKRVLSDHSVIVSHSGRDAIERIRGASFDLILCDLTMPGMSGMEFYDTVRAIAPNVAEHVVFMTGGAFTAESHEFLTKLPNSWLEKPFDLSALQELVQSRPNSDRPSGTERTAHASEVPAQSGERVRAKGPGLVKTDPPPPLAEAANGTHGRS